MNLPKFKNEQLFNQAFTHRSYLNETKEKIQSNERLEFLGDCILSYIVSDYLFRKYPNFNEGMLTNLRSVLVNTRNLAKIAKQLDFGKLLRLSKGEEESKGRENQSLLADSFEAFIGGLFLDQGLKTAYDFVTETVLGLAEDFVQNKALKDPKSLLQEYVQARKISYPLYKVLKEEGPPHTKIFTVGAYSDDKLLGRGEGKSKQIAEENAAKEALLHIEELKMLEKKTK